MRILLRNKVRFRLSGWNLNQVWNVQISCYSMVDYYKAVVIGLDTGSYVPAAAFSLRQPFNSADL